MPPKDEARAAVAAQRQLLTAQLREKISQGMLSIGELSPTMREIDFLAVLDEVLSKG